MKVSWSLLLFVCVSNVLSLCCARLDASLSLPTGAHLCEINDDVNAHSVMLGIFFNEAVYAKEIDRVAERSQDMTLFVIIKIRGGKSFCCFRRS